jgi:hypothetical protein
METTEDPARRPSNLSGPFRPQSRRGFSWAPAALSTVAALALPAIALAVTGDPDAPSGDSESGAGGLIVLAILVGLYLGFCTTIVWGVSHLMRVEDRTWRRAFELALLQFVIPLPVGLFMAAAVLFACFSILPGVLPATWFTYALLSCYVTFVVVFWWMCQTYTQRVYRLDFTPALAFNFWIVVGHAACATLLGAGNFAETFASQVLMN